MPSASPERAPLLVGGAILAGSALIALSVALTPRWSVVPAAPMLGAYRIDHWTGEILVCRVDVAGVSNRVDCTIR